MVILSRAEAKLKFVSVIQIGIKSSVGPADQPWRRRGCGMDEARLCIGVSNSTGEGRGCGSKYDSELHHFHAGLYTIPNTPADLVPGHDYHIVVSATDGGLPGACTAIGPAFTVVGLAGMFHSSVTTPSSKPRCNPFDIFSWYRNIKVVIFVHRFVCACVQ